MTVHTPEAVADPALRPVDRARAESDRPVRLWSLLRKVAHHRPFDFWLGLSLWVVFFMTPVVSGYLLSRGYESLSQGEARNTMWWAGAVAVTETVRMCLVHAGAVVWTRAWVHMQTLLRANMLAAQMASGGPHAGQPVGSAGSAVTHFRDDAEDVVNLLDISVDVVGGLAFTALAGFVLGANDPVAAAILIVPMFAVVFVTRVLDPRLKEYRRADRAATEDVTGFLGDVMAAATTVKVNGARQPTLARLRVLVDRRRETAVRDRVLEEGLYAFGEGSADVSLGLVLLVSAGALASGSFDVAQLALFASYVGWLSFLPRMLGRWLARRKQATVAFERMGALVADLDAENTVRRQVLPIAERDVRRRPDVHRPARQRFERLDVQGLGARYANDAGVSDATFSVDRGEFVAITGPIGSGKSTLLRAILGLARDAETEGVVRWNGVEILDRAAFLVPPNAAFLPQVPQLISDSVGENVSLGPADTRAVVAALRVASIDGDVAAMPGGVDTLIGPRGLRLSGGQRQRLATARALVHRPELVVLDDLSSAVDVETELSLWDNLADTDTTVIVVSHRAVALERADRIVRLEAGRVVAVTAGPSGRV